MLDQNNQTDPNAQGQSAGADQGAGSEQSQNTGDQGQQDSGKQPFAVFPDEASFMARVKREAKKQLANLVKELGFESPDQALEFLKVAKEEQEKKKTEAEKMAEKLAELERRLTERDLEIAEARKQMAFSTEAVKLGISDLEAAFRLMDWSEVEIDENGEVVGLKEALEKLVEKWPWLKGQSGSQSVGGPSNPPGKQGGPPAEITLSKDNYTAEWMALSEDVKEKVLRGEIKVKLV